MPTTTYTTRKAALAAGADTYITGKPCKHGHVSERRATNGRCLECESVQGDAWVEANKEQSNRAAREYARRNSAKKSAYFRGYYSRNADQMRLRSREHYHANAGLVALRHKARRSVFGDLLNAKNRAWRFQNPEKVRAIKSARRARIASASGRHTGQDIKSLFSLQRGRCAACRAKLHKYHVDHINPLALGGSNDKGNLQLLCPGCNLKKHAKHPVKFMQELGFLL